ncbi:MAG: transcription-repair coupling factor, partial [Firmicutes bacterium]|nr:transcription-repair coupling factor [Bacillota bacterium]
GISSRLTVLAALGEGRDCIVIAPVTAALKPLIPPADFRALAFDVTAGEELSPEEAARRLVAMGYERVPFVEAMGQFGIRGGIIDIFPMNREYPVRVELFDTEIDSVRSFDPLTQRSVKNEGSVRIWPASLLVQSEGLFETASKKIHRAYTTQAEKLESEAKERLLERRDQLEEALATGTQRSVLERYLPYFYRELSHLWDYADGENCAVIFDDPDRLEEALEAYSKEAAEDFKALLERGECVASEGKQMLTVGDLHRMYNSQDCAYFFTPFQKRIRGVDRLDTLEGISSRQAPVFSGRMDLLETELRRNVKQGYRITIACSTLERCNNMEEFLDRSGLAGKVEVRLGVISSGMDYPGAKRMILSDSDIFVHTKQKRKKPKSRNARPIKAFTDIRQGDYVVHESHGIGRFLGVEELTVQGIRKDYLKIKYAGEDLLYVPVEQMDIVQKYVGADGAVPKINKLSGGEWKKTKEKAQAAIEHMAKELLELTAQRKLQKGYAFSPDSEWQKEFEEMFPYEETADQLRCAAEIKKDMEKDVAMDRLLCGDVGYGKTEVAARAIFKCILDGKQAAVLVPTTILANQHYHTLKARMEHFPCKVEMLCRFRTEAQQDEIVSKLRRGEIDVIVGTHRMLSKDVKFKDLGLLVIDEEQRFGVQHKEAIKMLRQNVDVLTLSATPIPRTLHMSLIGIKDMSLIEEPPEERYPVQTYVMEQDDDILREAIRREMDRGGQVFVVYNRVKGIHAIASKIQKLVPEARIAIGHGQMNERSLEDVMLSFVEGEYDVLLATTIIESGIDIPNANTMIVIDADRYGLSQLYQLRGRVGRSNRMAYAYLMYERQKTLSEVAEKRLRAIREFTEFGAGFHIAMRDLEIRGAGNLLGTAQSGHMMMIGYELYCKLVEDAVRQLSGTVETMPQIETSIELDLPAFLPSYYISDEILKLQMYKKIAGIGDKDDRDEIFDEMVDRYGDPPREATNLMDIAWLKSRCIAMGISRVHIESGKLVFTFEQINGLKPQVLAQASADYGMRMTIYGGVKPTIRLTMKKKDRLQEALEFTGTLLEAKRRMEQASEPSEEPRPLKKSETVQNMKER